MKKHTITILGREYPCYMTMGAMRRFKRETGRDIASISTDDAASMVDFCHAMTASACACEGVEFTLDAQTFADGLSPAEFQRWSMALAEDSGEDSDDGDGEKKPLSIEQLLGIGVGCIGLSVDDFDRLTPAEFSAIADAWRRHADAGAERSWEIARTTAAILIQPHVRRRVTPRQLLPLPWDRDAAPTAATISREQQRARFEAMRARMDPTHRQ